MTDQPPVEVHTIAGAVFMARDLVDDAFDITEFMHGPTITADQKARRAARELVDREARQLRWSTTRDRSDDLAAAICDLHAPDEYGNCRECGGGDLEVVWPCETFQLLERAVTS